MTGARTANPRRTMLILAGALLALLAAFAVYLITRPETADEGSSSSSAARTAGSNTAGGSTAGAPIVAPPGVPAQASAQSAAEHAAALEAAARARVAKLAAAAASVSNTAGDEPALDAGPAAPGLSAEQQSYVDQVGDTRHAAAPPAITNAEQPQP